ncbi:MAG: hypothetical protein CM15mP39_11800 [Synechococcus sp.]|nr:MAG: hypothetical protein CM15mP39_11800 [Synechococcus sp.]
MGSRLNHAIEFIKEFKVVGMHSIEYLVATLE